MEYYIEQSKKIPVVASVDVLVAGGGPAGVGAALAAAREGAQVMLIEKSGCLGGMATAGMMSHWSGNSTNPLQIEIARRMHSMTSLPPLMNAGPYGCGGQMTTVLPDTDLRCCHEVLKTALQEMLLEAGVRIQLHTMAVSAIMDGRTVRGVVTESKSGREAIRSKVVVDATGDGDVAAFAGAEFLLGREDDNGCQPVTTMFMIGGVDYSKAIFPCGFESFVDIPKGEVQALGKSHLPAPAGHVLLYRNPLPGQVCVNMTNVIGVDGTNVRDLTRAEIECRRQMEAIVCFLREYVPGYEKCYLASSADYVGVRETRHFKGVYTLTAEDIVEAKVFDDWITTRNYFNFDIHSLKGSGLDENGAQRQFKAKGAYSIPYRACVPKEIDGLLLSGRNISGTHKAHSNYRVMGICLAIGQGVGTAAAIAVQDGVRPRDVSVSKVQASLLAAGVSQ